jgi:hypothetical protein
VKGERRGRHGVSLEDPPAVNRNVPESIEHYPDVAPLFSPRSAAR